MIYLLNPHISLQIHVNILPDSFRGRNVNFDKLYLSVKLLWPSCQASLQTNGSAEIARKASISVESRGQLPLPPFPSSCTPIGGGRVKFDMQEISDYF